MGVFSLQRGMRKKEEGRNKEDNRRGGEKNNQKVDELFLRRRKSQLTVLARNGLASTPPVASLLDQITSVYRHQTANMSSTFLLGVICGADPSNVCILTSHISTRSKLLILHSSHWLWFPTIILLTSNSDSLTP